ncbi:RNA-directed DNA polymerase, eukaryota [Tanacetum coccineum]
MVVTFSGEGCGVSDKVFCVSGEGGCDSGGEDEGKGYPSAELNSISLGGELFHSSFNEVRFISKDPQGYAIEDVKLSDIMSEMCKLIFVHGKKVLAEALFYTYIVALVRSENERFGTIFNDIGAKAFNHFISSSCLIDLPLEGYSFTWALKSGSKMSKLDRFLISEGLILIFPSLAAICLDRRLSDHRPILLRESSVDYGPTPFRVFHSWFTKDGFDNLIADTWNNLSIMETNKISLRERPQSRISELDKLIDKGLSNNDIINERISLLKDIHDLDKRHSSDLAQKAKIQWAIEGDENSKYFYGILIKNGSQLAIRGVLVDGEWIEDPPKVKNEFLEHFSKRFSMPTGPDGFSFEFIRKYWNIIQHDVVNAVKEIFSSSKFPPGSGRFTLNKAVLSSLPIYLMSIYKTPVGVLRKLPRGSLEEEQFSKLIKDVNSVIFSVSNDRWIWSLDSSGEFSIKSTRLFIDDHLLLAVGAPTRWVSEVPIKINIMACRKGSHAHIFFSFSMGAEHYYQLACWWEFDCPDLFSYDDWLEWFHTLRLLKGFKDILEGFFMLCGG